MRLAVVVFLIALCTPSSVGALEHVTFRHDGKEQTVSGQVVVTAQDGGLLLQTADGTLWNIEPKDLVSSKQDQEPFRPLSRDELAKQMLAELPAGVEDTMKLTNL